MPARKTSPLPTRIWKFSARLVSPQDSVHEILWRSNRYYNALVAIERGRHARYRAIRDAHAPELAMLEEKWEALDRAIGELYAEAKAQRAEWWRESRGDKARLLPADFEARKEALAREQKAASEAAKPLRAAFTALLEPARAAYKERRAARANGGGPRIQSAANAAVLAEMLSEADWHPAWRALAQSDDQAHDEALAARAACGLACGPYLGVEEAIARAKKDSAPHPPRFRRFGGEGLLRVQIRERSWATLSGGAVRIEPMPPLGPGKRSTLIRVTLDQSRGADKRSVVFTARLHRLPPDDAQVKWVALAVRKLGRKMRYELQLTLEHASFAEPKRPAGQRAPEHLSLGWARRPEGIRVASYPGGEVYCPAHVLDALAYADSVQGIADRLRDEAVRRLRLIAYKAGHRFSHASWQRLGGRDIARLRGFALDYARHVFGARREALWQAWRDQRLSSHKELYLPMHEVRWARRGSHALAFWCLLWACKHKHLEELAYYRRRRALHMRDAHYRAEAIRLATEFSSLTIDSYSVAQMKMREPLTLPGEIPKDLSQSQMHSAAPGRLREILLEVMGARCTLCERPRDAAERGAARVAKLPRPRKVREETRAVEPEAE